MLGNSAKPGDAGVQWAAEESLREADAAIERVRQWRTEREKVNAELRVLVAGWIAASHE